MSNNISDVKTAKPSSQFLPGTIDEVLNNQNNSLETGNTHILKYHSIYPQKNRDLRFNTREYGCERNQSLMVRVKVSGVVLTAEQYLSMDQLADDVVYDHSLRITSRQNFQLHGVPKRDLLQTIACINNVMLTTFSGCGDIERNIVAPSAPLVNPAHQHARTLAHMLNNVLSPASQILHELWLNNERIDIDLMFEPQYRDAYLPRKFKIGIAIPGDNSVDIYNQDIGLLAIIEGDQLRGVNLFVGGGMGMTHKRSNTYACKATPLGFAETEHILDAVKIIIEMFRDFSGRTKRRRVRLKYVVEEWGIERFREEFSKRASFSLRSCVDQQPLQYLDHLGFHSQGDDQWYYGVHIPNGRIIDTPQFQLKSALKSVVGELRPRVINTSNQNILFANLTESDSKAVEKILDFYHVPKVENLSQVRRHFMACPAMPTCGLALTESERVSPEIIDVLEQKLEQLGVADIPITVRMTGCPNGCARPYTADIALVGHKPGCYDIYMGGSLRGDRIVELYAVNIPQEDIIITLNPVLEAWAMEHQPNESFGDFYDRMYRMEHSYRITGSKDCPSIERIVTLCLPNPATH